MTVNVNEAAVQLLTKMESEHDPFGNLSHQLAEMLLRYGSFDRGRRKKLLAKLSDETRAHLVKTRASPLEVARAAICEFKNAVLLPYRQHFAHLDPPFPDPWESGSQEAYDFVESHGFPHEWAAPSESEMSMARFLCPDSPDVPDDPDPESENTSGENESARILLNKVGSRSKLLSELPGLVKIHLERKKATPLEVAEAAISIFHNDVLPRYREHLKKLPRFPGRWHPGSPSAINFVKTHGFPIEWAGDRAERTSSYFDVSGPYILPPLHDYQRHIVNRVKHFLSPDSSRWRAMISLPTGSGKTRIAIQGIVEAIRDGSFASDILWVVDRKELGEQAVVAWRQIWSGIGPDASLRITKMWASQTRELMPADEYHVVIGTIQTLEKREKQESWFDNVASLDLVVCDEAHGSISPTYTRVLQGLGLTHRARQEDDERKLLGLTATPYRSDEDRTRTLVNRYGRMRLDKGAFPNDDPEKDVQYLQAHGVLSVADFDEIKGGIYRLNPSEVEQMQTEPWLPPSVEKRIGTNRLRTARIINYFTEGTESAFPALIFATSVDHAYALAYFLTSRGIQAHAIEANTKPSTRKKLVDRFRRGEVKVLVNHSLLREGFDAPKTQTILVARPVYSPNLYFQMIGRGLRGPRNGGTERCKIVNVRDNIQNFGGKLAFDELEWLWQPSTFVPHERSESVPPRAIAVYAEKRGFSRKRGYFEHLDGRTLRPNPINDFSWELAGEAKDPEYLFPVDVESGVDQRFVLESLVGGLPRNHTVLLYVFPHGPLIAFRENEFTVG